MDISSIGLSEEDPEVLCFYTALSVFMTVRDSYDEQTACEAFCDAIKPTRSERHHRCFYSAHDCFDVLQHQYGFDVACKTFQDIINGRSPQI